MNLIITGFQYENSGTKLVQGIKGGRTPRRAIAGGNGSFIEHTPPKILVDLQDTETGRTQTIDMYFNFKNMLYQAGRGNMNVTRATKIIGYYQSIQPFPALFWDTWPEIPDLSSVIA